MIYFSCVLGASPYLYFYNRYGNSHYSSDISLSCHTCDRCLVLFSYLQYDSVGWAPKEYNPDDKQSNGPEQTGTDAGAPQSGFVWDEASGYYYDATSGFYYDGNTGMFLG